jgi:lysozyme
MARKKKRNLTKPVIIAFSVLSILAVGSYYISENFYQDPFVHYEAFGINIPVNYSVHGIDVSRYQQVISWKEVRQMKVNDVEISFAFIKATEGVKNRDEHFKRNWNAIQKAGIPRGAYHFFIASKSGKAQAENFIEHVKLQPGDLPPVLDIEHTNGASVADLQQRVSDWLVAVEKKYKVKPIIYTGADFYRVFLSGRFDDYPLWVAHYLVKDKPRINRNWTFWQHSETGRVNGIRSLVDFNVFNGDTTDFKKLLIQ